MPMLAAARRALIIFAAVIILAATSLLPIVVAVFAGATAMIGLGCLNVRQAFRAVDMRIVLLVATSLALGTALQETGGAAFIAMGIVSTFSPYGIAATLSALFLMIAILTNILSNNATAVLFTPIAVSAASQLGTDPALRLRRDLCRKHVFCDADGLSDQSAGHGTGAICLCRLSQGRNPFDFDPLGIIFPFRAGLFCALMGRH